MLILPDRQPVCKNISDSQMTAPDCPTPLTSPDPPFSFPAMISSGKSPHLLIASLAGSFSAFALAADTWPEFRGPTGQGLAEGPGPTEWSPETGVAWKVALPAHGWSSPVIASGKIILTGGRKKGDATILSAFALDVVTGKPVWNVDLFTPSDEETAAMHGKNSLSSSTPVIGGDIVYVHYGHMGTAALRLADGEVLWKKQIRYQPVHGNGGSPVLVDDLLVFNADAASDPTVVALHTKDGSVAWRTPREQEVRSTFSFSTPLVVENNGRTEILSAGSGMIGAYAPDDGRLLWKVTYGEGYSVVPRPVVAEQMLYVATGYNVPKLLAIRLGEADGDVTETHIAWEVPRRMPKTPSMIVTGGQVLALDDTGTLTSLDAKSGDVLWNKRLPGNFSASPILSGKILYAPTEDGVCYVLEISPTGAEILSETDIAERTLASPVLLGGALYLRTEENLWKITGD